MSLDSLKRRLSYLSQAAESEQKNQSARPKSLDLEDWAPQGEYTFVRKIAKPLLVTGPIPILLGNHYDIEDLIFYDTETTGLSGGAGTVVFLVGIATLEGSNLSLEQIFLSDYPGEEEFLEYLSRRLNPDRLFVSYNGKGFDSHLLKTRFLMSGRQWEMPNQLDLLYIARRFWKRITGVCTLGTIEQQVLGIERSVDIPSAEIPDMYFQSLRTGDYQMLYSVFEHNLQDVCSLVDLFHLLGRILRGDAGDAPVDHAAVGRFLLESSEPRGIVNLNKAVQQGDALAGRYLGQYYKRHQKWEQATAVWEEMARAKSLYAIIELAKYYEHRRADPKSALEWVSRIESWRLKDRIVNQEVKRRRERLEKKINRIESRYA